MKKQKPNRMSKKNRKYIKGSAAYYKRKLTQFNQREAEKTGTVSPRRLARSVGQFIGQVVDGVSVANASQNAKAYIQAAIEHPKEYKEMLNPPKRLPTRVIRKVEP